MNQNILKEQAQTVIQEFQRRSKLYGLTADPYYEIKERSDGGVLIIYLLNPTERFFEILEEVFKTLLDNLFFDKTTLQRRNDTEGTLLNAPETRLLQRILSESLTVHQHSVADHFFSRFANSVLGVETPILSPSNHIVFGRRGAGKTTLLVYAKQRLEADSKPTVWFDMQSYRRRDDYGVVVEILKEWLNQLPPDYLNYNYSAIMGLHRQLDSLMAAASEISERQIRALLPSFTRLLKPLVTEQGSLTVFIDDLHLIAPSLQPVLLSILYSIAKGKLVYLKISAIEDFAQLWDAKTQMGLQIPHDVQSLKLDYNLTQLEPSKQHIENILNAQAIYCGLPGISKLCGKGVLTRLVWVSGAVPRDALKIFSQALNQAALKQQKQINVTNINLAASEMIDDKVRELDLDMTGTSKELLKLLEQLKQFCIKDHQTNAFLVKIANHNQSYDNILKLVELRLLHIIHQGLTLAGEKFIAVILDYGFYVGKRTTQSVDLFYGKDTPLQTPKYEELRKLPVFKI